MFPRIHRLGIAFVFIIGGLFVLWAFGALWYDLPLPPMGRKIAAGIFLAASVILFLSGKSKPRVMACALPMFVTIWWLTLRPSNDRAWQPDVAESAWAEINGDEVVLHNVRNCDYRTETDYTPHWETRRVRLSQITGIDMAVNYWGSPYMAHPIISFQFADAPPVCFSIETRKEIGESYSAVGGLYRQYELIYIAAEERDVIRVRTNFRKGEDVYLYRLAISPRQARERFVEYLTTFNQLKDHPRWYNAITTNCTTSIRTQHHPQKKTPWDWRILVNGKGDEMMYEKGQLITDGLPFATLKQRALINESARAADGAPNFSSQIRTSLPAARP